MKSLVIIPARGGSKGIPHKNIKPLAGQPLIYYTLDVACQIAAPEDICVSTDDEAIIQAVRNYGLDVPFVRPAHLATDHVGTYEVLLHALHYYEEHQQHYDNIILLQPTSPFRTASQIREAMRLYSPDVDMVVGVREVATNPYYNCYEEDDEGFLHISKGEGAYVRRQDAPVAYEYNGAIYIINVESLRQTPLSAFRKRVKYVMDGLHSVDIDTPLDWLVAETMLSQGLLNIHP